VLRRVSYTSLEGSGPFLSSQAKAFSLSGTSCLSHAAQRCPRLEKVLARGGGSCFLCNCAHLVPVPDAGEVEEKSCGVEGCDCMLKEALWAPRSPT
jgi:hypothetical protein